MIAIIRVLETVIFLYFAKKSIATLSMGQVLMEAHAPYFQTPMHVNIHRQTQENWTHSISFHLDINYRSLSLRLLRSLVRTVPHRPVDHVEPRDSAPVVPLRRTSEERIE
jgi:hypothetical protein